MDEGYGSRSRATDPAGKAASGAQSALRAHLYDVPWGSMADRL